jgi:hypothetical protein
LQVCEIFLKFGVEIKLFLKKAPRKQPKNQKPEIQRRSDDGNIEFTQVETINGLRKVIESTIKKYIYFFKFFIQQIQIITPEQNKVTHSMEVTSKKPKL